MKVMCVFGTRPEAIKLAPVIKRLNLQAGIETKVCVTAQHREMMDQVLDLFDIIPDYDLDIMSPDQSITDVAANVLKQLESVLKIERPDWMLVQGDTTTVMAAAIVGFYNKVKVGHVEAGLRTHNKFWPFPEEINRRIAGVIADHHFAPTSLSKKNLLNEGVNEKDILITGNTVIDALNIIKLKGMPSLVNNIIQQIREKSGGNYPKIILMTAHRRENFGHPIQEICEAVITLSEKYKNSIHFVYPVHLNPNIQKPVYELLNNRRNITLVNPLQYDELVHLVKESYLVLTDSGGIQEEAPALGKPVLVLRDVTERPEAISAGTAKLVGTDKINIINNLELLIENENEYNLMAKAINPYGDGESSKRIVDFLLGKKVVPFHALVN